MLDSFLELYAKDEDIQVMDNQLKLDLGLYYAVKYSQKNIVEYTLSQGADIHLRSLNYGNSNIDELLKLCIQQGYVDILKLLHCHGLPICTFINNQYFEYKKCLGIAVKKGHLEIVKYLLHPDVGYGPGWKYISQKDEDEPYQTKKSYDRLQTAIKYSQLDIVKYLCTEYKIHNIINYLYYICIYGNLDIFKYGLTLIDNMEDKHWVKCVYHATIYAHISIIQYIIDVAGKHILSQEIFNLAKLGQSACHNTVFTYKYDDYTSIVNYYSSILKD